MNVQRLSTIASVAASTADQIVLAGRRLHPQLKADAQAVAPLILRAEAFLEANYGVVCQPDDYRLSFVEECRPALLLPIFPVTALAGVTRDGETMTGWALRNGHLFHRIARFELKAGSKLVAIVRAGWDAGEIPHLVEQSLAILCQHWIVQPADDQLRLGQARHEISGRLASFLPAHEKGVAKWL